MGIAIANHKDRCDVGMLRSCSFDSFVSAQALGERVTPIARPSYPEAQRLEKKSRFPFWIEIVKRPISDCKFQARWKIRPLLLGIIKVGSEHFKQD